MITVLVAAGCGSSGKSSSGRTITLQTKANSTTSHFVDVPPKSPTGQPDHISPGDQIIQTEIVENTAGHRVGTSYCVLTFITASVNFNSVDSSPCVYSLKDGTFATEAVHGPGMNAPDAIVGGTGAYNGARGILTTPKTGETFTLHLLP